MNTGMPTIEYFTIGNTLVLELIEMLGKTIILMINARIE